MTKHREFIVRRFPRHKPQDVPRAAYSLAMTRTEHLGATALETPLRDLLASAWLQGVIDAAQAVDATTMKIDPTIGLV